MRGKLLRELGPESWFVKDGRGPSLLSCPTRRPELREALCLRGQGLFGSPVITSALRCRSIWSQGEFVRTRSCPFGRLRFSCLIRMEPCVLLVPVQWQYHIHFLFNYGEEPERPYLAETQPASSLCRVSLLSCWASSRCQPCSHLFSVPSVRRSPLGSLRHGGPSPPLPPVPRVHLVLL